MAKAWDPKQHLRDPIGRFRYMGLRPGWHPYKVGASIYYYYVNDLKQLSTGSTLLAMSSKGENTVFTSPEADAVDRIHLIGNENGELMGVAGKGRFASGVINHDKMAPPENFSLIRGSQYRDINKRLEPDQTSFGGTPFQTSDRLNTAGEPYDVVNAQLAERTNAKAFTDKNSKVYGVDTGDLAGRVADARNYYRTQFQVTEGEARKLPVFVYFDGKHNLHVEPSVKGFKDDGSPIFRRSPNSHGGSPTVKLECQDITRISRAMQTEGIDNVNMVIAAGTSTYKSGRSMNNAIYLRTDFENPRSHEYQTVWSCIENKGAGIKEEASVGRYRKPDGSLDKKAWREHLARKTMAQRKAAKPYWNPRNSEEATTLLHKRWNNRTIRDGQVRLNPPNPDTGVHGSITITRPHVDDSFDMRGERLSRHIKDRQGALDYAKQNIPHPGPRPTEDDVTIDHKTHQYVVRYEDGTVGYVPMTIVYNQKKKKPKDPPDAAAPALVRK